MNAAAATAWPQAQGGKNLYIECNLFPLKMHKLLFLIPWLFLADTGAITISGQFYEKRQAVHPFPKSLIEITARKNNKVLGKGQADSTGHFYITLSKRIPTEVDLFTGGLGVGQRYIGTVNLKKAADTATIRISFPIRISMGGSGRAICPKCRLDDATVPVRYGDGGVVRSDFFVHEPGDFSKYADIPYYDMLSCLVPINAPEWVCARDKIFF